MQSLEQITRAVNALGITASKSSTQTFEALFTQRNIIAHELDLLDPEVHGTSRRQRLVGDAWLLADKAYHETLGTILTSARTLRGTGGSEDG